jgi:UDP-N-acetylglucosamine/UDP-N-acetylgalactosamine diphosphorylase
MVNKKTLETTKKILIEHNQQHLLMFWDELDEARKQRLLEEIGRLDFSKIDRWIEKYVKKAAPLKLASEFQPAPSYPLVPKNSEQQQKYKLAVKTGRQLISAGKVAAFVVAGGQGTRLGFDGPKGDYPISPVRNKTLFQIFAETIKAACEKYHADIPWYIMTSPINYSQTLDIFRENSYYNLNKENIFIFQQGTMPNFGLDGKILLADKGTIASSPDGHGGSLKALYKSGALEDMKNRGVDVMSYWQVDNPLVKILDPLFIGLHMLDSSEMSSKALVKNHPKEKVGNFCLVNGRVTVIEYSDLPDKLAEKRNPDGSFVFELGSIGIHIISRSFVERLNTEADISLPFHRAVKKIVHINESGQLIKPAEPNGIKLETFIFDALPLADNSVILQTVRSEEFAPVKNATGIDSAEVTRRMIAERSAKWLESAGVAVPRKKDGSLDCLIEIAPSFAFEKEQLEEKANRIGEIKAGGEIYIG